MKHRGFTLIELLVVIAIIAILAAILFPVFAQAKAQAKAASELSNTKEMGLATIMYTNDSDDEYEMAMYANWDTSWVTITQPYIKNIQILRSPFDSNMALGATWLNGWAGIAQSMASNSYFHQQGGVSDGCGCSLACVNGGILNFEVQPGTCGFADGWIVPTAKSSTAVTQPAGTIMMGYKYNTNVLADGGLGNLTAFGPGPQFGTLRHPGEYEWIAPVEIPDGTLPPTNGSTVKYATGANGSVSLTPQGKANFVLADGHAKLMDAASTDPDPVNKPTLNMWDADR